MRRKRIHTLLYAQVIVLGNGQVGKTSMMTRFAKGTFSGNYKKTIGVDFMEKTLMVDSLSQDFKFMIWDTGEREDSCASRRAAVSRLSGTAPHALATTAARQPPPCKTAGQEEFNAVTRTYYRGAGAALFVFSTTDRASFEAVEEWTNKVKAECGDIAMAIVQNKIDLLDRAAVANEEVEALARRLKLRLYRTSVKDNLNVKEAFVYLAELFEKKLAQGTLNSALEAVPAMRTPVGLQNEPPAAGAAGAVAAGFAPAQGGSPMKVDIAPSKRRTGGKKSKQCVVM